METRRTVQKSSAPKKIATIQFGTLTRHEIQKAGEVRVSSRELFQMPHRLAAPYGKFLNGTPLSHTHTLTLPHSHTHTLTHSHTQKHTHIHTLTPLSLSLSLSLDFLLFKAAWTHVWASATRHPSARLATSD